MTSIAFLRARVPMNQTLTRSNCPYCLKTVASSPDLRILEYAERAHSCRKIEIARIEQAEAHDPMAARMFRSQIHIVRNTP